MIQEFLVLFYCSDMVGSMRPMVPSMVSSSNYGRGGPASYGTPSVAHGMGGRGVGSAFGSAPAPANYNGHPPFVPPSGGFSIGRGGGRMDNGKGHDGGRGFNAGRGGGRPGGTRGGRTSWRGGASGGRGRHGGSSKDDLDHIALPKPDLRNLVPFEKNFYIESPSVRAMSDHEVMQYRASREITVQGHDVPKPIRMFHEANFPGILLFHGIMLVNDFSCVLSERVI